MVFPFYTFLEQQSEALMETTDFIQQVAELTGFSIDILRYYERIKLLEPVDRTPVEHSRYRQKDLEWSFLPQ